MDLERLRTLHGNVTSCKTPSGFEVVIREQNGADDDTLTNAELAKGGDSINAFIANITVYHSKYNTPLTKELVEAMPLKDKYFILLFSRMFSMGEIIKFQYKWEDRKNPDDYIENISDYIWDYNELMPEEGSEDYNEYRIKPYTDNPYERHTGTLQSGKVIRFKYIDGIGEKYLINLDDSNRSRNSEMKARELELKVGEEFKKVESFKSFSTKDMQELRKLTQEVDPALELISIIKHPTTKEEHYLDITSIPDFLFPRDL